MSRVVLANPIRYKPWLQTRHQALVDRLESYEIRGFSEDHEKE